MLRDGALIGIVSRADLLHALQRLLVAEPKTAPSDETIRRHVLAEAGAAALPPHGLTVDVANGVVTLGGVILDEKMRGALGVAAENVPGVKAVVDRIVWVEPVSNPAIRCPLPSAAENQKGRSRPRTGTMYLGIVCLTELRDGPERTRAGGAPDSRPVADFRRKFIQV